MVTLTDSAVDHAGVSWGEDGWIYYDGHLEGDGIARVPEEGGAPRIFTVPDTAAGERFHMAPHALPGGRGVLFMVARGNVATGEESQVALARVRPVRPPALRPGPQAHGRRLRRRRPPATEPGDPGGGNSNGGGGERAGGGDRDEDAL